MNYKVKKKANVTLNLDLLVDDDWTLVQIVEYINARLSVTRTDIIQHVHFSRVGIGS